MGYTHYWRQKRAFTKAEWTTITAEARRICAKAEHGSYYQGKEDIESATTCEQDQYGFRVGLKEAYAWRTFPHPEAAIPHQGAAIKLAGPSGEIGTSPRFSDEEIALNGVDPDESYESFILERDPKPSQWEKPDEIAKNGIFNFTKTEYRPYDAVVVSILHIARTVAPDAITVSSDGGPEAIKLMF